DQFDCIYCVTEVKSDSDDDRGAAFSSYSSSSAFDKPSPAKKAKKPTEAAPKPWKPPSTTKKPDTSVWDSDSDTAAKKPPSTPLFKGPGKGRGRKRKHSDSEEDYRPLKKTGKVPSSRKPKKAASDEDDDEVNSKGFSRLDTSRDRSGRAKKEIKYFTESDDDDMFI
ncbi:DNA topoisomerase 2-beta isoform X1, partial [Tachysurus ichikawai]